MLQDIELPTGLQNKTTDEDIGGDVEKDAEHQGQNLNREGDPVVVALVEIVGRPDGKGQLRTVRVLEQRRDYLAEQRHLACRVKQDRVQSKGGYVEGFGV